MEVMTHFTQKCCHLVSKHEASAWRLCSSVRQFLIYSTFVLGFGGSGFAVHHCCPSFSVMSLSISSITWYRSEIWK